MHIVVPCTSEMRHLHAQSPLFQMVAYRQAKLQLLTRYWHDAVGIKPERNISATLFWLAAMHVHLSRNPNPF